jgi:thiamine monophosphate synthase
VLPFIHDLLSIDLAKPFKTHLGHDALAVIGRAIQLGDDVLQYIDKHPNKEAVTRWLCNHANCLDLRYMHKNAIENLELAN